jgi:hypothetical protein
MANDNEPHFNNPSHWRQRAKEARALAAIRLSPGLRQIIDDWRRNQLDVPSRSEAIRRLVEQALADGPKRRK